ncbi:sulfate ABC transporter substrate-binding protein [Azospirillum sp. RWY-5-1]|uniref:Sulfate ABC transporter substrate-binding protein n=2 Tax=Azospirillum oleiclasticum TaxID=2735135 RepID=A0ABX2TJY5_9PROT|nr:sulfate ABC transporter substrate-binding protein [Azospirillum oleiclasticum]NYZ24583.1 sulfate ABC transporter substrate-binding protein [Azospirillum oleiclasticum]
MFRAAAVAAAITVGMAAGAVRAEAPTTLLNVSYDIARELYVQVNEAFGKAWKAKTGQTVEISQSHGGSSRQARAIIEGLQADVVTFNQVLDVQALHDRGKLIPANWQARLPNNSSPYYSLPAFLVRKGNPKGIKDWNDLIRSDVESVFPNPKTSGNARYTYLGAYAYALDRNNSDQAKATEFVKALLARVPVFDTGGRAATTTFVERQIGDVLITFEAEVYGIRREYGEDKFDIVVPSLSILAEFPVSVVDKVVDKRGSRELATAYLNFLYGPEGQDILARNFNRIHDPEVAKRYEAQFPKLRLVTIEEVFGGWEKANKDHFASGGILDRVFVNR